MSVHTCVLCELLYLSYSLQQNMYDHLMVSLITEATYVRESMHINWVAEEGLVENIKSVVKEFKQARGLHVGHFSCMQT